MRVEGKHKKCDLYILIDSGSTHNFIDKWVAERLGCDFKSAGATRVKVAYGRQIEVSAKVSNFKWYFQGVCFQADVIAIPLGGCDMVLGCQWLETLGPITWDFKKLQMCFSMGDLQVSLYGIQNESIKIVKAAKLSKMAEEHVQLSMICVEEQFLQCSIHSSDAWKVMHPEIQKILEDYVDLFEEPATLPPFRGLHDHMIPLLEGSHPVNQRPYMYAIQQKSEFDIMIKDMLKSGIIQHSSSSFASPIVLVKKKDDTWRLCVDYRGLNDVTVKNIFPILLIEDLMDELGGAKMFSNIDLRACYHQVRMAAEDIHKTAFKTHSGHYEYLVMPFGLKNVPATFQGLMNAVFQKFLRKFVLVFFYDILIYSSSLESHLSELRFVFETMRKTPYLLSKVSVHLQWIE